MMYWSFNKRDAFILSLIGLCISLAIAGSLIWLAPKIVKYKMVDDLPYTWYQVGLKYRVWYEVDDDWPWNDSYPPDAEAVSGTWVGLPFPAVQRRIEYPPEVYQPGFMLYSPDYLSRTQYQHHLDLYRPHWIGLLADTILWGTLIWFIRCLWRTFLAHKRLRQGNCAFCGYDQSGLQEPKCCPECGKK